MLEKPDLPETLISSTIQELYGLTISQVTFLPLGYDLHTAVYRLEAIDGQSYFLKLRQGNFLQISVSLPVFLSRLGIKAIIAPLETRHAMLFGHLQNYTVILYPFVSGRDGYEAHLTDHQWVQLGQTFRLLHAASLPPPLAQLIPVESLDPLARESVSDFLSQIGTLIPADPIAARLITFMQTKRGLISHMLRRAGDLAEALQKQDLELVLCHNDAHPGNYHVAETGRLYLVDWDNPIYAPKERDLMCVGSGMAGSQPGGREERLFYHGYGRVEINRQALAYYRYERILQDINEFCKQILLTAAGADDRAQSYSYFISSFETGAEVDVALHTDDLTNFVP
jgi:spectinomycin phosphotransferase